MGTAAAVAAGGAALPYLFSCRRGPFERRPVSFRPYQPGKTAAPVTCVTPDDGFYIHTFYDVTPFSPSGRYLAVTRLPFQDHDPVLGETADVCVIDLQTREIFDVYSTRGWGFQLGANLNWGATDRTLYTNDVIDGCGVCVRLDLESGGVRAYSGPMYHIAPDESCVIGFPLDLINATQRGYGVPEDPDRPRVLPPGASGEQGLWRTELERDGKTLLLSLAQLADHVPDPDYYRGGTFYLFHSKFNRQNSRIMQVLRCMLPERRGGWNPQLFTFDVNGANIRQAVTREQWAPGGHHPNWHPDGEHLIMNLKPDGETLRFCTFAYDGSGFRVLSEKRLGSGHPSVEASGRYLISDAYPGEPVCKDSDQVPIRLVDLVVDDEITLCTLYTLGRGLGTLRVDPHPAWDRNYSRVCFNGAPDGARGVYIADLTGLI